jgi:hypothetical protein
VFARRFGQCALAVAGEGPMPRREACESDWGRAPSAALAVPPELRAAAPPTGDPRPEDALLGRWFGTYESGREVMLVITRVAGGEVEALYAFGPAAEPGLPGGTARRVGRFSEGTLLFAEPGLATLRYRMREDGLLEGEWIAADERARLATVLRRLP